MSENKTIKKAVNWLLSQGIFSSQKEIGEKLGIENKSYLSQLVNSFPPNEDFVNKFMELAPQFNRSWLLTGEGAMLKPNGIDSEILDDRKKDFSDYGLVPLVNIDSVGGIHSDNAIATDEQYVMKMIPFSEARPDDRAIFQSGNSMYPIIPSGSVLLIREVVDWREYFGYGSIYVLWLRDGRRITKEVRRYDPDPKNYVMCVSFNPDVADEELPRSMIRGVWKVVKYVADFGW